MMTTGSTGDFYFVISERTVTKGADHYRTVLFGDGGNSNSGSIRASD